MPRERPWRARGSRGTTAVRAALPRRLRTCGPSRQQVLSPTRRSRDLVPAHAPPAPGPGARCHRLRDARSGEPVLTLRVVLRSRRDPTVPTRRLPERAARRVDEPCIASRPAVRSRRLLDAHRPDVAHLHNVYHQLTLSDRRRAQAPEVPIVLTMHDWKVACPAYTLFTEGAPCRRCPVGHRPHAVAAPMRQVFGGRQRARGHRGDLARRRGSYGKVQRFIAPSRFASGRGAGRDRAMPRSPISPTSCPTTS